MSEELRTEEDVIEFTQREMAKVKQQLRDIRRLQREMEVETKPPAGTCNTVLAICGFLIAAAVLAARIVIKQ